MVRAPQFLSCRLHWHPLTRVKPHGNLCYPRGPYGKMTHLTPYRWSLLAIHLGKSVRFALPSHTSTANGGRSSAKPPTRRGERHFKPWLRSMEKTGCWRVSLWSFNWESSHFMVIWWWLNYQTMGFKEPNGDLTWWDDSWGWFHGHLSSQDGDLMMKNWDLTVIIRQCQPTSISWNEDLERHTRGIIKKT